MFNELFTQDAVMKTVYINNNWFGVSPLKKHNHDIFLYILQSTRDDDTYQYVQWNENHLKKEKDSL